MDTHFGDGMAAVLQVGEHEEIPDPPETCVNYVMRASYVINIPCKKQC